jgi:hypothetical protein
MAKEVGTGCTISMKQFTSGRLEQYCCILVMPHAAGSQTRELLTRLSRCRERLCHHANFCCSYRLAHMSAALPSLLEVA